MPADVAATQDFGRLLRAFRVAAGLTQEELAERSGMSVRALSDMERGRTTRPFARSIRLLADALCLGDPGRVQLMAALPRDDGDCPASAAHRDGERPQSAVPHQMPAPVRAFTGRAAELAALSGLLDHTHGAQTGTVVISAIGGTAGVGKTALVTQWAHQIADRFPDGQLYVNLRGYDPGQPVEPSEALAGFLLALGVPGQDIPAGEDQRATLYRSVLTGRRMLIVADNARSADQVRPLLPGASSCVLAVTSRDSLAGLVARDGARRLDLDILLPWEASELLRALIGGLAEAHRSAAAALAEQCSRLPLALRVAAELVNTRTDASLSELVSELADQRRRLDLLNADGDPRTSVRSVFSWSYQHLDRRAAQAFRLLGLLPGADFDRYGLAVLTGRTLEEARRLLKVLARAYLIQPGQPGRYVMHDLLRAYARELAETEDTDDDRNASLTRLFDYYLRTAAEAMNTLFPAERHRRPSVPPISAAAPRFTDQIGARAWLDSERASMTASAAHAAEHGWARHAIHLAAILFRYLTTGGYVPEAVVINRSACIAAREARDRAAEAAAMTNLGALDVRQGRYADAAGHLQRALELSQAAGDRTNQARAQSTLGNIYLRQGDYGHAARCHKHALALHESAGDRTGEGRAHVNLGIVEMLQGHYLLATRHYRRALAIRHETGDQDGEGYVRINLGEVYFRQDRYPQAARQFQNALALFRRVGDRTGEAHSLTSLGSADLGQGRLSEAADHYQQGLALCRETGDRSGEAEALSGIGEVLIAADDPGQACTKYAAALTLAREIGEQDQLARAHTGLANAYHAMGDSVAARRHWQEALILYDRLGAREADELRATLASTDG